MRSFKKKVIFCVHLLIANWCYHFFKFNGITDLYIQFMVLSLVLPIIITCIIIIMHLMKIHSDIPRYSILWKRNADGRVQTTDLRICKSGALPLRQPSIYTCNMIRIRIWHNTSVSSRRFQHGAAPCPFLTAPECPFSKPECPFLQLIST